MDPDPKTIIVTGLTLHLYTLGNLAAGLVHDGDVEGAVLCQASCASGLRLLRHLVDQPGFIPEEQRLDMLARLADDGPIEVAHRNMGEQINKLVALKERLRVEAS